MKIQFLESSLLGLQWMRPYYRERPHLKDAAARGYQKAKDLLRDNSVTGRSFDGIAGVSERSILNTPFSILYTVKDDTIYVIDIRDGRGHRSERAVREYTQHLKKKYHL